MHNEQPWGVAAEVLAYLRNHPNAADTLDGIVSWWLPRQRYETERRRIERALDELAARRLVVRHRLPDGEIVYACSDPGGAGEREQSRH